MKKSILIMLLVIALAACTVFGMMVLPASATEADHPHTAETTHCACGGMGPKSDHKECSDVTWTAWTSDMDSPTSGNYYLAGDVTISAAISLKGSFKLCLNGYTLTVEGGARAFTYVGSTYYTLEICDCSEAQTGKITTCNSANQGGVVYFARGKFSLYSGTLENTATTSTVNGGVIRLGYSSDTTNKIAAFWMYGGTLQGGVAASGGSIYSGNSTNITIELLGGTITGGKATSGNGGNINLVSGKLNLNGTTICNGTASKAGGNIYVASTAVMTDGHIYGGSAPANCGDNVQVQGSSASLTMSGGYIGEVNQTATNAGHNVNVLNGTFTMTGGTVKGLARAMTTGTNTAAYNLSGNARICGGAHNLLLASNGASVTVGELGEKASIGLTQGANYTNTSLATAAADPGSKVFSDYEYSHIVYNEDGTLTLEGNTMQVGYGKVSIAPAVGTPLGGYGDSANRLSTGNDESYGLMATAIAITDSEGETVLLITADLVSLTDAVVSNARTAISEVTGVAKDHIMISATHTHTAPDLALDHDAINTYKTELYANLATAAQAAIADQAEATAAIGSYEFSGKNYIRHYTDTDGNYYGYEYWASQAIAAGKTLTHAAEADCTMQLIKFDRGEDKTPVVLANWQTHPHMLGNVDYASADLVGAFRETLAEAQGWSVAYFSGASGNVNPTSLTESNDYDYIGLGNVMSELAATVEFTSAGLSSVRINTVKYAATYKEVTEDQYNAAVDFLAGEDTSNAAAIAAGYNSIYEVKSHKNVYELAQVSATKTLELNAISLGRIAFVTAPYEMFDVNGKTVKEASSHAMTFVLTQANGSVGYIPSDLSTVTAPNGIYELDSTKFVAGTGEELANTYVSMLAAAISDDYCICGGLAEGKENHTTCTAVSWESFPENGSIPTSGNYYLDCDLEISSDAANVCVVGDSLAIDLRGHTLTVNLNGGRLFNVASGKQLSICDTEGDGKLVVAGTTTTVGGVFFNNKGSIYIFNGTVDASGLESTADGVVIRNANSGLLCLYNANVIGGKTTGYGGAISNAASLYIYTNTTISGGQASRGGNIYTAGGTIRLYGTLIGGVATDMGGNLYAGAGPSYVYGKLNEGSALQGGNIYHKAGLYLFGGQVRNAVDGGGIYAAADFTVGGAAVVTGNQMNGENVNVYLSDGILINAGTASTLVADGASIGITMANSEAAFATDTANYASGVEAKDVFWYQGGNYSIVAQEGYLYFQSEAAIAYYLVDGAYQAKSYPSLEEAIAHEGVSYVSLRADYEGDLTVSSDLYLDLAGHSITGTVTVAEGATLYGMDNVNDDYVTAGGKIAAIDGSYAPVHSFTTTGGMRRYVAIAETDGISFHRYYAAITAISLDPANDALGYKATIRGDELVMSHVSGFGFNMWVSGGQVKSYVKTDAYTDGHVMTLRLKNILAAGGGEMDISAQAVVQFSHVDDLAVGSTQTTTMKETLRKVNAAWEDYSDNQKLAVQTLCGKFEITKSWELSNIFPAA